jgi:hypothetical protein
MNAFLVNFSFVGAHLPGSSWVALLLMALLGWVWMV